jgi:hypothetical protein
MDMYLYKFTKKSNRWSSCWTYLLGCYRGRYIHFFRLRFNYSFSGQAGDDGSEGTPVFHMDVLRSGRTVIIGPMACLCRGCEGMEKQLYGNYQFSLGDHRQFFGV